jgi:hypothetical protein
MLEGHILLDEAMCEFEKLYIKKALAKRVATYKGQESPQKGTKIAKSKKAAYR